VGAARGAVLVGDLVAAVRLSRRRHHWEYSLSAAPCGWSRPALRAP